MEIELGNIQMLGFQRAGSVVLFENPYVVNFVQCSRISRSLEVGLKFPLQKH